MGNNTYQNSDILYEVALENGQGTIKSPNKPGPGWVRVTPEIEKLHAEMHQSSLRNIAELEILLREAEAELLYRTTHGLTISTS